MPVDDVLRCCLAIGGAIASEDPDVSLAFIAESASTTMTAAADARERSAFVESERVRRRLIFRNGFWIAPLVGGCGFAKQLL